MRRTSQTLLPIVLLASGLAPAAHAEVEVICPAGQVGVRFLPQRVALGPAVRETGVDQGTERHPMDVELPGGARIKVVITTPAIRARVGGFSYTLVIGSPGLGACVNPFDTSQTQLFVGEVDPESSGEVIPTLDIDIHDPARVGQQRCQGIDRDIAIPDVPLDKVKIETTATGCRIRARIAPR